MNKQVLLTSNNAKTLKGEKKGYKTFILYMSPFTQNIKGTNLCSHASNGCANACLFGSGRGGMFTKIEQARVNKTNFFVTERQLFLERMVSEITKHIKKYGDTLAIRMNGTSDVVWEKLKVNVFGKSIIELFPNVQFYDYTKNHIRYKKYLNNQLPSNYHLTFSRSEINDDIAMEILSKGGNVAMVFNKIPTEYKGYKVINGDENDLRFIDDNNVIVGLKYKLLTKKGSDNKLAYESNFAIEI
jgi:hypothetical protein